MLTHIVHSIEAELLLNTLCNDYETNYGKGIFDCVMANPIHIEEVRKIYGKNFIHLLKNFSWLDKFFTLKSTDRLDTMRKKNPTTVDQFLQEIALQTQRQKNFLQDECFYPSSNILSP